MFIIELTYKKTLHEVDKFLEAHRAFLQKYYDQGVFVASGPKNPRDGGVIIALADKESIEALVKEDPFYQNDTADYRFIQFEAVKYCDEFKSLFRK